MHLGKKSVNDLAGATPLLIQEGSPRYSAGGVVAHESC
jgi:hypothetical protein